MLESQRHNVHLALITHLQWHLALHPEPSPSQWRTCRATRQGAGLYGWLGSYPLLMPLVVRKPFRWSRAGRQSRAGWALTCAARGKWKTTAAAAKRVRVPANLRA